MNQNLDQPDRPHRSHSLGGSVAAAVCVGLVGCALLGTVEAAAAILAATRRVGEGHWPLDLKLAAIGQAVVTQLIVWLPLLLISGAVLSFVRRPTTPEAGLAGFLVLVAAVVVVPADLSLAGKGGLKWWLIAATCGVVLAGGTYLIVRVLHRRWSQRRFRTIRNMAAALAAGWIVLTGLLFARSPLYDPAGYGVVDGELHRAKRRPNVLWIVLDTVRADRLGLYNSDLPTTPFLNQFATNAMVFERCMSNGIWTVPSHASMFTGMSTRQHGMDVPDCSLDLHHTTVADVLSENGYATACFSNNPWFGEEFNLVQGFDERPTLYHLNHAGMFSIFHLFERYGLTPRVRWLDKDSGAATTNHLVARWLDDRADSDAPVFVFVNYMEAHLPYRVPSEYRRKFLEPAQVDRSYDLRQRLYGSIVPVMNLDFSIDGPGIIEPGDVDILRGQYDACIRYLDDRVRELLGMFESRGLLDDTLVIITSDHGEYLDTHGMWSHCFKTYDDVARVVLLLREPGRTAGARRLDPVQPSDLYATVLNFALGSPPADTPSRDLLAPPAAASEYTIRENSVCEYRTPAAHIVQRISRHPDPRIQRLGDPQKAVSDGRYKYIRTADGGCELYDLTNDPGELTNLCDSEPAEAQRLSDWLDAWLERTPEYEPAESSQGTSTDPAVLKALRSLGYVGGED